MTSNRSLKIITKSPEETLALGERLGKTAQPGDILLLSGHLGVGKTCLTQGIARGLGSTEYALSPTFVLMREIKGKMPLYHMDLYRLDNIVEISDLGLDDYLFGTGVSVIEWAEKGLEILPDEHLMIKIEYLNDNERSFEFNPRGKRYEKFVSLLNQDLKKG